MTPDELRDLLVREIEDDPEGELLASDRKTVKMYDHHFGRYVNFHVEPRTVDEIREIVHFGPSLVTAETDAGRWAERVAEVLAELDPHVLLTLEAVLVVSTVEDCEVLTHEIKRDFDDFPENLLSEDDDGNDVLDPDLVGVSWFQESVAVVNVDAIRRTARELYPDDDTDRERETEIGFWTTLLHEIRHDQVDVCPYELPWLSDEMTSEENVEEWALREFERLSP